MRRVHRASEFQVTPDQARGTNRAGIHGTVTQNYRGNLRTVESGKSHQVRRIRAAALPDEHVIQMAAVAANNGLNFTMPTAVGAPGNLGAILANRTFKAIGAAHFIEIQLAGQNYKPGKAGD